MRPFMAAIPVIKELLTSLVHQPFRTALPKLCGRSPTPEYSAI